MRLGGAIEHRTLIIHAADHGADTAPSSFIITTAASLVRVRLPYSVDDRGPPAWRAPPALLGSSVVCTTMSAIGLDPVDGGESCLIGGGVQEIIARIHRWCGR